MKNLKTLTILFILPTVLEYGCSKEKSAPARQISSTSVDNAVIPKYYFSPWAALDGRHINFWFSDLATANAAGNSLVWFMAQPVSKSGNIFTKKVASIAAGTPDMEDPCDPGPLPPDEILVTRDGTTITRIKKPNGNIRTVIQKANGETVVMDCGGSDNTTTFTITFTFYTPINPFAPDYTGYLTVTEDEYHQIVNVTFTVKVDGYGYGYGDYETTIPGTTKVSQNDQGHIIAFDHHGQLNTAMGLGRLQMHAGFKNETWGYVQLDHRNNPVGGKAQMKQY